MPQVRKNGAAVRQKAAGGMSQRAIATELGVEPRTVSGILSVTDAPFATASRRR
jgi:transcriptional regulator with XRE-family HTH domain